MDNPATLSAELAALFPPGAVAAEVRPPVDRALLTAAELGFIAHCAEKRIADFAAGRACAHRVLEQLGHSGFSLLSGQQREPLWPASLIGSITHTRDYAAAVAARTDELPALGLDCEIIESVDAELWSRICTEAELARLANLPRERAVRQAALIFAAKEAFYKCQFPLTRDWVGFEDVSIEMPADLPPAGSFRVVPEKPLSLGSRVALLHNRYFFRERWVLAGVSVPARP